MFLLVKEEKLIEPNQSQKSIFIFGTRSNSFTASFYSCQRKMGIILSYFTLDLEQFLKKTFFLSRITKKNTFLIALENTGWVVLIWLIFSNVP